MLNYGNSLELPKVGVKNNNQSLEYSACTQLQNIVRQNVL